MVMAGGYRRMRAPTRPRWQRTCPAVVTRTATPTLQLWLASLLNQEMILRAGTSIHSPVTPAVGFKPNMPPRLQVPADYTAATGGADSSDGHRFAQVSQSFYYYLRLYFPAFF